ncbi:thrombomodulin [Notolabrus celidotus]|uniref:thrombomodulin n=1 Tax=Notolabrus celidotus TaxID=1203425 RepID=UPI00148FF715|nr:thrombomodulin [Notolabrus celidotus]
MEKKKSSFISFPSFLCHCPEGCCFRSRAPQTLHPPQVFSADVISHHIQNCSQLTVFLPVKVITMTIWMIFLLSVRTGFGQEQGGTCRPFCSGSDCVTLNHERVDFKTAKEACHGRNGELMTFQTKIDETILHTLSQELYGNFWIGLYLPSGTCSNLSAPLRGYKWTSGSMQSSFIPSLCNWNDGSEVCSSHCVSLSNDQKLTERLCTDRADGYLCKMKYEDACQAQKLTDPIVFQSSKGCSLGPCEHLCTDVKGGYKCSCFKGYIPDTVNPRKCKMHCSQHTCPAICQHNPDSACFCPNGYIAIDKVCEDIDECSMDWCSKGCKNTYGSFVCSCPEGFVLKDEVRCIKVVHSENYMVTTPIVIGSAQPAANNNTFKESSTAGGFLWIWIFLALAVVVLIIVIRFYVVKWQKGREQNFMQQSAAPVDNIEC